MPHSTSRPGAKASTWTPLYVVMRTVFDPVKRSNSDEKNGPVCSSRQALARYTGTLILGTNVVGVSGSPMSLR